MATFTKKKLIFDVSSVIGVGLGSVVISCSGGQVVELVPLVAPQLSWGVDDGFLLRSGNLYNMLCCFGVFRFALVGSHYVCRWVIRLLVMELKRCEEEEEKKYRSPRLVFLALGLRVSSECSRFGR